jgi:hypothetical protein
VSVSVNHTIRKTVFEIEALSIAVPLLFIAATCGIPLLRLGLPSQASDRLLYVAVAFAAARLATAISGIISIHPLRRMRYQRVAQALADQLRARLDAAVILHKWSDTTPGALGMTRSGKLVLIDRSTQYYQLDLSPEKILVSFETEHLGLRWIRWLIGDFRIGETTAWAPWAPRQVFLAIRYRGDGFGPLYITRIAFGDNQREAEMLYTNLSRLSRPSGG